MAYQRDRPRFPFRQRLRRLQEFLEFLFFPRFRFQLRPNRKFSHDDFLLPI